MRVAICAIVLAVAAVPTSLHAETFRCLMERQITVGAYGPVKDDKEADKGREHFLAINNSTQKGTYSTCFQGAACSTWAEIPWVTRYESDGLRKGTKNIMIRMIVGGSGQIGQIWSLEQDGGQENFTAIAVSAQGQRSDTALGTCTKIIDR
jgi:hypothetical protein